jgi:cellulose synthase/poly-beta-1,6-N-acetylglucosamine synthase-like glycosyltransferase
VDDYPSCNLLVRTSALRTLGGFRTDYWPGEDTLLCMDLVHSLGGRIVYEPRVLVYHHRRPLFLPHLRQVGRYALHRGFFARRFPATSRRIGYLIPSLFVLGLVAGAPMAVWNQTLRLLYLSAVSLYALATLLNCIDRHPGRWLLTWFGMIATHLVYGTRFLQGLVFGATPSTVQRFDHPSENPSATHPGASSPHQASPAREARR